jgi:hypothetical protein
VIAEFTPGNELEEIFVRAATDPTARVEFYRRLLSSEIYVLTQEAPLASGESTRETSASSPPITWEGPTGPYVPLFSSRARVDEISKSRERALGYVAMRGQAAFALLAEKPRAAFLNPGFACGKQFTPEVIERLADAALPSPTGERPVTRDGGAGDGKGVPESLSESDKAHGSRPWWKIW